jgi:Transposase
MTGARLVHDTLEQEGCSVEIADAQKVKGLAPLACKTDKIDSLVLATLSHRDLVPAIWLPDPSVREERALARFRMHLVKHKSALKNRVHSTLINFGRPCPVTDLCGAAGRRLLATLDVPDPWQRLQLRPRPHRAPHQRTSTRRYRLRRPQNQTREMNQTCRYISGLGRTRRWAAAANELLAQLGCCFSSL